MPCVPDDTPTRRLVEDLLAEPLEAWVLTRRAVGSSWADIASELGRRLDGARTVHRETLRAWFAGVEAVFPFRSRA